MEEFVLFLDESITHSGKFQDNVFSMCGVIVKQSDISIITTELDNLKIKIWSDKSKTDAKKMILHQMEVIDASKCRNKDIDFNRFRVKSNRRYLYDELSSIFNTKLLTVIGATINENDLKKYFSNGNKTDKYLIALQLILENYCHFLCNNSGVGSIVYESRNDTEDERMRNRFYQIKLMGSMYIDSKTMEKRLRTIHFEPKSNNHAGLQIADFVPNVFARKAAGFKLNKINIFKPLRRYTYDGRLCLRDRFGIKNMP